MRYTLFTAVLLLICSQLLLAIDGKGQSIKDVYIQLDLRDENLITAIQKIEQRTQFLFAYKEEQVAKIGSLNLRESKRSVEEALRLILKGTGLEFRQMNKNIIITRKPRNDSSDVIYGLRAITVPAWLHPVKERLPGTPLKTQDYEVRGTVTDAQTGEGLPGVTIVIQGLTMGTTTDVDGNYRLDISPTQTGGTLSFTLLGYVRQEAPIAGQHLINIELQKDVASLEAVVVVGYGTMDKREVTSAITHISSDDFLTTSANNPLMNIQGKVAGLSIVNNGAADPNSGVNIQLRGVTSREAGYGPLIVVDGVPGVSLENISRNEIASIDVLKDGAASSIYGTRGSNGVIVITTKSGGGGAPTATYNGYVSWDRPGRELEVLSAEEYLQHERGDDNGSMTDWLDATRRTALTHNHSLAVSGGNARNSYRAVVDYRNANGVDLRSARNEYGGRLSVTHTSKNELYSVSANLAPRYYKRENADWASYFMALTLDPTKPVMDPDDPSKYNWFTGWQEFNPVERAELEEHGSEVKMLNADITFKLNLMPNLNTTLLLSTQTYDYFNYSFIPSTTQTSYINNWNGQATRGYDKNDQKTLEWLGNYFLDLNDHSLKLMGGYSYHYFQSSGMSAENRNFPSDVLSYNNLGTGLWMTEDGRLGYGSYKNDSRLIAFLGRASYNYRDKYMLTASLRYEGSSKFGINHKWGYFPGASVGWRLSAESFMESVPWVNDLKLRADIGVTGNQNFGNYISLTTYSGFGYYPFEGTWYQVFGPARNPNPDLRWEKGINANIGLDFSILDSRVGGSLNFYRREQQDLLGSYLAPTPPFAHPNVFVNVGTMRNIGLELELSANLVRKAGFDYTIDLAASTNDNKFVSFSNSEFQGQRFVEMASLPAPGSPGPIQRLEEGKRIGSFYMYKHAGIDDQGRWLIYDKDDNIILSTEKTIEDRRYVGNGLPKYFLSLSNRFKYGNWDMSVFFRGVFGFDVFNVHDFYYGIPSVPSGQNVLSSAYGKNAGITVEKEPTDYFLEKGGYFKLDVVSLGYTFQTEGKYFNSARFYISSKNLATFTGYSGVDPETIQINGLTPGVGSSIGIKEYYPPTRQLLFGVQLDF